MIAITPRGGSPSLRGPLDTPRHLAERVHIEAGVELVQDGDTRPEDRELEGLVALGLATGEVDVHRTRQDLRSDPELGGLVGEAVAEWPGLGLLRCGPRRGATR